MTLALGVLVALIGLVFAPQSGAASTPIPQFDGYIVKFKRGATWTKRSRAIRRVSTQIRVREDSPRLNWSVVSDLNRRQIAELEDSPDVEEVIPDYLFEPSETPDDTDYGLQWHHGMINSQQAWDRLVGFQAAGSPIVAVIDGGFDTGHPDLAANLWTNSKEIPDNGIDDDGNGRIDDVHGWSFAKNSNEIDTLVDEQTERPGRSFSHGAHVMGIIGAVGNNAEGASGVLWSTRMMPLDVFNLMVIEDCVQHEGGTRTCVPRENDQGEVIKGWRASTSLIANALLYAAYNGATVVNMSLGSPASEVVPSVASYYERILEPATSKGVMVVAAAGNEQEPESGYPAAAEPTHDNVISVAALGPTGQRAYYSNYGTNVDIAAPGGDMELDYYNGGIYSALNRHTAAEPYGYMQGTSMASPVVAGAVALYLNQKIAWKKNIWAFPECYDRGLAMNSVKERIFDPVNGGIDVRPELVGVAETAGRIDLERLTRAPDPDYAPSDPDCETAHTPELPFPDGSISGPEEGPVPVNLARHVTVGESHVCVVATQSAHCKGSNSRGQIGAAAAGSGGSSGVSTFTPALVDGTTAVSAGSKHTCAVRDGGAWCWGDNGSLRLGITGPPFLNVPAPVPGLTEGVTQIAAGGDFTCALQHQVVKCFGDNSWGQLGRGQTGGSSAGPEAVAELDSDVTGLVAGGNRACAISDGSLYCWGRHLDATPASGTPTLVSGMTSGVTHVALGDSHVCAIRSGEVWCWGENAEGQLGTGDFVSSNLPVQLDGLGDTAVSIAAAGDSSCAAVGTVAKCWGSDNEVRLGFGDPYTTSHPTPYSITGISQPVRHVAAGKAAFCFVTTDQLRCTKLWFKLTPLPGLASLPMDPPLPYADVTFDLTPPEQPHFLSAPESYVVVGSPLSVTFASDGSESKFICQLDGDDWNDCSTGTATVDSPSLGDRTLRIRAVDAAGNQSAWLEHSWTVGSEPLDLTAPVVAITKPTSGQAITTATTAVSFTVTEDSAHSEECRLDAVGDMTAFVPCSSGWTTPMMTNGEHVVTVRSEDEHGNVGTVSVGFLVAVPVDPGSPPPVLPPVVPPVAPPVVPWVPMTPPAPTLPRFPLDGSVVGTIQSVKVRTKRLKGRKNAQLRITWKPARANLDFQNARSYGIYVDGRRKKMHKRSKKLVVLKLRLKRGRHRVAIRGFSSFGELISKSKAVTIRVR